MRRPRIASLVLLAFAATLACCDKGEKQTEPTGAAADSAKPSGKFKLVKIEEPEEPEPPEPKLTKKKLSELSSFDYMDILKAAGWTESTSGGMAMGAWEKTTITTKQGGKVAAVTIVAPTGEKDDPNASVKAQPPKHYLAELQAKGAAELLKDDFLLAVTIEGDPEGAKKLLAHIKEWIIVE